MKMAITRRYSEQNLKRNKMPRSTSNYTINLTGEGAGRGARVRGGTGQGGQARIGR